MVDGLYTFAQTGEQRYAQLHFKNEKLTQVVGFTSETDLGAPREITPEQGDTFTIYEKWMDVNSSGQVGSVVTETGHHADLRLAALHVGAALRGRGRLRHRLHRRGPGWQSVPGVHAVDGAVGQQATPPPYPSPKGRGEESERERMAPPPRGGGVRDERDRLPREERPSFLFREAGA